MVIFKLYYFVEDSVKIDLIREHIALDLQVKVN